MRSLIRAAFVAVAFMSAVPTASVLAQSAQTQVTWTAIPPKNVPMRVTTARMKLFKGKKVTKVEVSGSGDAAIYRFKMTGNKNDVKIDAAGKIVR